MAAQERAVLELSVRELRQMFNNIDPAPFHERDLDPGAESYIVEWSEQTGAAQPLALEIRIASGPATTADAAMMGNAVDEFFEQRAERTRRRLRRLFRVGRISLVIGLAFLAAAIVVGEFVAGLVVMESYGGIVRESFVIGGWVALWRPLEIFLYEWWPIRREARLYDRLGEMQVALVGTDGVRVAAPGAGA